MRPLLLITVFTMTSLAVTGAPFAAVQAAQTPKTHQHGQMQAPAAQPGTQGKMTMDCNQMMQMHQKMMQDMQAMDSKLDTLVQQMNSATGQAKVDATAAVVNEMVAQRKQMREGMEKMQSQMMEHMAEHMASGAGKAMMNCPMMQEMKKEMK